jgi:disulfide bond formation protein DsbB
MRADRVALWAGAAALALILGALGFQYLAGLAPCEMCHWQRWPHIAAAIIGLGGVALMAAGLLSPKAALPIAALTLLLIAVSGLLGVYHAGVEWHFWEGPAACTGPRAIFSGLKNLNAKSGVLCDVAQWRLFGMSLAGFNAVISLSVAAFGAGLLLRGEK